MKRLTLVLGLLGLLISPTAHGAVNSGSSFILGAWQTEADLNGQTLQEFEASLGVKFTHHKWYLNWDQPFHLPAAQLFHAQGRVLEVTWQPWIDGVGIPFGDIASGKYDTYIRTFARDVRAWGHPVLIAIAPEMDGWWSPWAVNGEPGRTNLDFITGYRRIVDAFREEGVSNVAWVWSPNVQQPNSPSRYRHSELYPGDAYVTYMGLDGYNWGTSKGGTWESFSQVFRYSYDGLVEISTKPILLMEVASAEEGGSKAAWIRDMFVQLPNFPRIVGFTWFNRNRERDWRIHSSIESKEAFTVAAAEYFRPQGGSSGSDSGPKSTPQPEPPPTPQSSERPIVLSPSQSKLNPRSQDGEVSVLPPAIRFEDKPWSVPSSVVRVPFAALQEHVAHLTDPRVRMALGGFALLLGLRFLRKQLRKRKNPYEIIRAD